MSTYKKMTAVEQQQAIDRLAAHLAQEAMAEKSGALALSGLMTAYSTVASRHATAAGLQECANFTMQLSMWLAMLANERRAERGDVNGSLH